MITGMKFFIFMFVLYGASLFYIWEHLYFVRGVKNLIATIKEKGASAALEQLDWKILSSSNNEIILRRAFKVPGVLDALRYGAPVFLLAMLALTLHMWGASALFLLVVILKWGVSKTVINTEGAGSYRVTLFDKKVFGEVFQ